MKVVVTLDNIIDIVVTGISIILIVIGTIYINRNKKKE